MAGFLDYVLSLEKMAVTGHGAPEVQFAPALDGEAGAELRRLVALPARRELGAFFTGSHLAERLVTKAGTDRSFFFDPSCGAGDLLLAAARRLPIATSLTATVRAWSHSLGGIDVSSEFVRAAKARLVLLARARGIFLEELSRDELKKAFPLIGMGDGLATAAIPSRPQTVVLMNPPYTVLDPPVACPWGAGKVNVAAVFVDHFASYVPAGTQILAILPDVLRSGSNYRKWRERIAAESAALQIKACGLFDANADVDVFMLDWVKTDGTVRRRGRWPARRTTAHALEATFNVSVGAVVPHRHRRIGTLRRYLDARTAPSFGEVRRVKSRRKFRGPVVQPPFVTIKRTSRPGDLHRAVPTVITGTQPVAVENHLIVCKPKDGSVETCRQLARQLESPAVTKWLNDTIRCRHLTVKAVRLIRLT